MSDFEKLCGVERAAEPEQPAASIGFEAAYQSGNRTHYHGHWAELLRSIAPGKAVDLENVGRRTIHKTAKRQGLKIRTCKLNNGQLRVWRLK